MRARARCGRIDGARPGALDKKSGRLAVDDLKRTFKGGSLKLDHVAMTELAIRRAGTRYTVNLHPDSE